ncbi:MAG: NUDIX hydrolase [Candidatus Aenigmarchaeota archaeon]|nr:NUDIX hydrolase [Candidatus Aenigmarchaeota archaeon]
MKVQKIALISFYDEEGRILLQDRRGMSKYGEEWGFFGGGIEKGETPEEAIVRETKEELDYDLEDIQYLGNCKSALVDGSCLDCYIFLSPLEGKMKNFRVLEGNGMKLYSFSEIGKLKLISADWEVPNLIYNAIKEQK